MKLSFTKMQGCANDYIYLDCRTSGVPEEIATLSQRLSRRHFSIGADGIICICAPVTAGADAMMRIFNADGSEGKMCGNGIRCVAEWLYTHGMAKPKLAIDTLSGLKTVARMGEGLWQVEMGAYTAMAAALPAVNMGEGPLVDLPLQVEENLWRVTCISVGNPHCVTIVPEVDSLKLEQIGPGFEHHENFPERINTEFVQVVDATHLKMRVWERGSGETWACGTGTCATVAALTELGICPAGEDVHVQLRGGELTIRVLPGKQLLMTRGALTTFSIANDVAKYFAIIPAIFLLAIPELAVLNIMHLATPSSAILSALIFNAVIIPLLIPIALKGVKYRPMGADALLARNLFIYGLGGVIAPFIGIKLIDMVLAATGLF